MVDTNIQDGELVVVSDVDFEVVDDAAHRRGTSDVVLAHRLTDILDADAVTYDDDNSEL